MEPLMRAVVTMGILVFAGKMLAGAMRALRLPSMLGDLLAGVILSSYALGGGIVIFGEPLIVINDHVMAFARSQTPTYGTRRPICGILLASQRRREEQGCRSDSLHRIHGHWSCDNY